MTEADILLKNAGYKESRRGFVFFVINMYKKYGCKYTDEQIKFLKKCCGLQVKYRNTNNKKINSSCNLISLKPVEAQKYFDIELLTEYEEKLGCDLLILGRIIPDNSILFLSSKGVFYEIYDGIILDRGKSLREMVDNIMNNKYAEKIAVEM